MRTARVIVVLAAAEVTGKLGTLVVVVGAARVLSLADFGRFSVALGVGAMSAVLPSWGFDTVVIQRGAVDRRVVPPLLAEVLAARAALSLGTLAVLAAAVAMPGLLGLPGLPATVVAAGGCVVAACLVETLTDAYRAVAVAWQSQGVVAVMLSVQRALAAALTVFALAVWRTLLALSVAYLLATVAGLVAMAVGVGRLGARPRPGLVSRRGLRALAGSSWSIGVHSVASMALFRVDGVLLAALAGAAAAGRYAAAYRLLETVVFVCWTVSRAVFPMMATAVTGWQVRRGAERGLAVLAAVFAPYAAVMWCRGGDVLRLLYGEELARTGVPVLAWLAPAPLLFGAAYLAAHALLAAGPSRLVLVGSLGALAVNVGLNLVLIPRYGPVGAAAATSVSYAVEIMLLQPVVNARAGRPALVRPLLPAVLAAGLTAAALLLPLPLLPALLLAGTVYLLAWSVLARWLDAEQWEVVRGVLTRGGASTGNTGPSR
jgi:O-antigen/teichoic acid export membrane protein